MIRSFAFPGGAGFTHDALASLAALLVRNLQGKYPLQVRVAEPVKVYVGVDLDPSGPILQTQSHKEIPADTFTALAFRPNRLKNHDMPYITQLRQQGLELPVALTPLKISDHHQAPTGFADARQTRLASLKTDPALRIAFAAEIQRLLPSRLADEIVAQALYCTYLVTLLDEESRRLLELIGG